MRILLLLRHAKASRGDVSMRDFERPLEPRGELDAPRVGRELAARGPLPSLVVSSPAVRARQTTEAFMQAAGLSVELQFNDGIYSATAGELMKIIWLLPDDHDTVLLVGHNPGFEEMLARLARAYNTLPTAGLACLELPAQSWSDIEDGSARLRWLITPDSINS